MNYYIEYSDTTWREPVATSSDLPTIGNTDGDTRVALADQTIWIWQGSSWHEVSGGGGGGTDSFYIMQPDNGTAPTATSATDTLTLTSTDKSINITGDSSTDTLNFREAGNYSAGSSGTTKTIDWVNGPAQEVSMTGNCTFTLSNGRAGMAYVLELTQDGTGGRTATWPASVKWPGGVAVVLSTAANAIDLVSFYYDGTNYLGTFAKGFA